MKNQFDIIKSIISDNNWEITNEIIESPMAVYQLKNRQNSELNLEVNLPNKSFSVYPNEEISREEVQRFKEEKYKNVDSKYVIKTCYPQRSETIYLYLAENGERGKKDAKVFNSFFDAYSHRKSIEDKSGRRITNWKIETK